MQVDPALLTDLIALCQNADLITYMLHLLKLFFFQINYHTANYYKNLTEAICLQHHYYIKRKKISA